MPTSPEAAHRERARRAKARELEALQSQAVAELGFVKRKGLYLAPLAPGIERWLALPVKRDGDTFSVYPNVGVRHDELHETVDRLFGRKSGTGPTLVRMLGYLMPQNSANVAWEFSGIATKPQCSRGFLRCRRRDSNPRHADYDSAALTD